MKTEFELNLDSNGRPCIKFRHYDKSSALEQKALKVFIDAVKDKGMELRNISGHIDTEGNSWENYEVQICKQLPIQYVSNRRELLIKFCDALFEQNGTQITNVQIDFLMKKFNL